MLDSQPNLLASLRSLDRPWLGRCIAVLIAFVSAHALVAAEPAAAITMPLWDASAPGEPASAPKPETDVLGKDNIRRIGEVWTPTISVYQPPADKRSGTCVVVCPGGGYHILAMDLEGTEVATWLNSIGVTAVVLKYRVPKRTGQPAWQAAVQDGQRAVSLVRSKAAEWGITSDRIGILGFSAGGNLAGIASTAGAKRYYEAKDAIDQVSCRPDFSVLIYPATGKEGRLQPEIAPAPDTPPAFLVMAGDDKLGPENAIAYYLGLKEQKVAAELHLYPTGGHGFGLRPSEHACSTWPARCQEWLIAQKLIPPAK